MAALIWIGLSLCVGYYGRFRRLGFIGWSIVAFVLSPFTALLILFLTAPRYAPLWPVRPEVQQQPVRKPVT